MAAATPTFDPIPSLEVRVPARPAILRGLPRAAGERVYATPAREFELAVLEVGPDGYLYLLTDESDGGLYRLEPAKANSAEG